MSRSDSTRPRLPKGVTELTRPRGGRAFLATVRAGKGGPVQLGLYETPWLAAVACRVAAEELRRDYPPLDIPVGEQPGADRVREIGERVRRRLGLGGPPRTLREEPPRPDDLLALFEVTVVEFWRREAAEDATDRPGSGLDAAATRLVEAAHLLFWSRAAGHPDPLEAMTVLLTRRLERAFRGSGPDRELLADDGDEPWRVARWLVYPDGPAGGRGRGFREEVRYLYPEHFEGRGREDEGPLAWADLLGLRPPFDAEAVRAAFRARSREAHPDAGGSDAAFVRLRAAYEQAMAYCEGPGR